MEKRPEEKNDLYYSELERKQTRLLGDMTSLFYTFVLDGLDGDV